MRALNSLEIEYVVGGGQEPTREELDQLRRQMQEQQEQIEELQRQEQARQDREEQRREQEQCRELSETIGNLLGGGIAGGAALASGVGVLAIGAATSGGWFLGGDIGEDVGGFVCN